MTAVFVGLTLLLLVQIALVFQVILNALTITRLGAFSKKKSPTETAPPAALLIPARNESNRLPATLGSLSTQLKGNNRITVLDDQSTDQTTDIIRRFQQADSRIRLLEGAPLPEGWTGKNWACWQLAASSDAEWLLFTDADVIWHDGALSAVLHAAQDLETDLLTVWPTQEVVTIWERLVVPMMSYATLAYLPWLGVHHLPFTSLAAANGQCLVLHKNAYKTSGGHRAVKSSVIEDIELARRIKKHGLRLRMVDGDGLIRCRMYQSWPEVRDGYAKNILAGHGSPLWLLVSTFFHWLLFIFPMVWLLTGWLFPQWPLSGIEFWPAWPAAMVLLTTGSRMLSAAVTRQPLADAFFLPLSVFLMTIIAFYALRWHFTQGGPSWKGRVISTNPHGTES